MKCAEIWLQCDQRDRGCGFNGNFELPMNYAKWLVSTMCAHHLCPHGRAVLLNALTCVGYIKVVPEHGLWEFNFRDKPGFYLQPDTGEVFQVGDGPSWVPVGLNILEMR